MNELIAEIKKLVIDTLNLEDISPADIDAEAPLFVEGLGLDSIDALELGVALQRRYGLTMLNDAEAMRPHFGSVARLADFVAANRSR